MMNEYFYDSYAIISFLNGSKNYEKYFKENIGITTYYNVMEVYYSVLKDSGDEKAKQVLKLLKSIIIQPTFEDIPIAMAFRIKNSHKRLSYADCLGYAISFRLELKFLTGDESFKNLLNVEFVKETL